MSKRSRRVIVLLIMVTGAWLMAAAMRAGLSRIDYSRAQRGEQPLFAWQSASASDGGTIIYQGLGYEIEALHRFHVVEGQPVGFDVGPILTYQLNWLLLPQTDRRDVSFQPNHLPSAAGEPRP